MSTDVPLSMDPTALPDDPALLKQMLVEERTIREQLIGPG
jgi:hypothetical protein